MKENIIDLNVNELKPGMVVAKEIQEDKKVLISKDVIITDAILMKLKSLYILEKVSVYIDSDSDKIEYKKQDAKQELENVEYTFNEICLSLHETFNKIKNLRSDVIKEVRELTKQLQNEVKDPNIIINDIVFYGSGKDSIYRHGINVAAISNLLGMWLKLDENKIKLLTYSALLHDVGKTKIDDEIFNKPESLTKNDYKIVKSHPILGYNIVKEFTFLDKSVSQGILMHHEREDGSGYPLGIKGDKICEFAKIIAIADVFDAINSNRSYRKKKSPFEAIQIIKKESFGKLDYNYCNVFLSHILNYYMGREVFLNTNKQAKIIQMDINELDRPLLFVDDEFLDLKEHKELYIEKFIL
ncbi:HD-GYP domain-containing protein [Clostridium uliginosum]|uniref:HDIG domain-containing protein n=1 Tax=Clostridium uliginosum TaxID=119641 RepID=A0A1I1P365_9CLOT|nr:HD-GYP domain-containing protein [Clostridium uliginosum]SFD00410.1 HDIG domain-containing protein [Clostridium uliginosum]